MKETFEDYLQRLKDRRTEDDYKYTDEDFIQYEEYITDCWLTNLSVYKCLEFMYFAEKEIQPEQIWNDEKKEGLKEFIDKHKQETLEEAAEIFVKNRFTKQICNDESYPDIYASKEAIVESHILFAKWQQEQHDFLPGFIKQFDPKEGEIKGWTAVEFLKWLDLNKFKIIK
jgi:hypothetical protein